MSNSILEFVDKSIYEQMKNSLAEEILADRKKIRDILVEVAEENEVQNIEEFKNLLNSFICEDEQDKIAFFNLVDEEFKKGLKNIYIDYNLSNPLESLVKYISQAPVSSKNEILKKLQEIDSDIAENVRSRIILFEDIALFDDRSVQKLLREIDIVDLEAALKGFDYTTPIATKIFKNMSKRAANMLKKDIENLKNISTKEIENAQQKIIEIIQHLIEEGELSDSRCQELCQPITFK